MNSREIKCNECGVCDFKHSLCEQEFCERFATKDDFEELIINSVPIRHGRWIKGGKEQIDKELEKRLEQTEIVRCKDCKWWQDNATWEDSLNNCKWISTETPDEDDFCSCGERMADEEDE